MDRCFYTETYDFQNLMSVCPLVFCTKVSVRELAHKVYEWMQTWSAWDCSLDPLGHCFFGQPRDHDTGLGKMTYGKLGDPLAYTIIMEGASTPDVVMKFRQCFDLIPPRNTLEVLQPIYAKSNKGVMASRWVCLHACQDFCAFRTNYQTTFSLMFLDEFIAEEFMKHPQLCWIWMQGIWRHTKTDVFLTKKKPAEIRLLSK